MKKVIFLFLVSLLLPCYAWEGYDYENGTAVSISKGNLVRSGQDIEVYDYDAGEYRNVEVNSINRVGNTVEVEVYDYGNDEYRILEMYD